MRKAVMTHIDGAVDEIRDMFIRAAERIEALKTGEKVAGTTLANTIANEITAENIASLVASGMTQTDADAVKEAKIMGPAMYAILKQLFIGYPNTELKRGAQGGIIKLAVPDEATAVVDEPVRSNDLVQALTDLAVDTFNGDAISSVVG